MPTAMNPSLNMLLSAILAYWDDEKGEPLETNFCVGDFDEKSVGRLSRRFSIFVNKAEKEISSICGNNWSSIDEFYIESKVTDFQLEIDFVLTCNRLGGFWEKNRWKPEVGEILDKLAKQHGEFDACVDDKGAILIDFSDDSWESVLG
jgi:hypothetical protein